MNQAPMSRMYKSPREFGDLARWADSRETHLAVASAIHAIADKRRSPEAIWADPTSAEWDHVTMAVEDYLLHNDFERTDDGRYQWGEEAIELPESDRAEAWRNLRLNAK